MTTDLCTELDLPTLGMDNDSTVVLRQWIDEQAEAHQLSYLLAHAEDGVIWGHFNGGSLLTSGEVFDRLPILRPRTLQQCRIFGEAGEILLWRTDKGWQARLCQDKNVPDIDFIEEKQMLWGTQAALEKEGFTLVADGSQGLKHAVPLTSIPFSGQTSRPINLKVRHYISYDEDGVAYIFLGRLVNLSIKDSRGTQKNAA